MVTLSVERETEALHAAARPNGHRVQDILVDYTQRRAFRVRGGAK